MGIVNDFISGLKNNLKWQAQGAVVGGVTTGVRSIFKGLKNRCPKCGKSIKDEGANFCPNCRANLILICKNPACGRQSLIGTKFCPGCGAKLKAGGAAEETKVEIPPAEPTPPQV
jgi:hypothetical protein